MKNNAAIKVLKPRALKKGDRVALISPASRPDGPAAVKKCQQLVSELGFVPVLGKSILSTRGYMAGCDMERLDDFNNAIQDDSIAGIFCISGGFGSMHLLPHLDYDQILSHPKVLIGGDDNTSLLVAINAKTGLVTFHGPNLDQIASRFTFENFRAAITSKSSLAVLSANADGADGFPKPVAYAPVEGSTKGRLLGGNLTALVSLMGTPYQPEFNNAILFLEDRDERFDTLDRWLTTLYISGYLKHVSGVALGQFANCGTKSSFNMLPLEDLFGDRLSELKIPSCFNFSFGQVDNTATIPIGVMAQLDSAKGTLEFTEGALV
jgi:muramoyltetrapeptide carboxypeptidase